MSPATRVQRIRSSEDSPLAARSEVLISPTRPRSIFAAIGSLPSLVVGFLDLVVTHEFTTPYHQQASGRWRGAPPARLHGTTTAGGGRRIDASQKAGVEGLNLQHKAVSFVLSFVLVQLMHLTAMMSDVMAMDGETLAPAVARGSTARAVSLAQGQAQETSSCWNTRRFN